MSNNTLDVNTLSALLGILFMLLNAVITSFFAIVVWTWKANEFKNRFEKKEILTDNKLAVYEKDCILLSKKISEYKNNFQTQQKDMETQIGNVNAELQHIKNYLIKVSNKKDFDTFVPPNVRKRDEIF